MAAIFPPADKGGVPPGPAIKNGYTPTHAVVGEGPLYVSPDCTTILTDGQLNALTSEILAAVDKLGFSYNSSQVTNLGDAITAALANATANAVQRTGDTMIGALVLAGDPTAPLQAVPRQFVVARGGDTMTGPLILVATPPANPLAAVPKGYVDGALNGLTVSYQAADTALQTAVNGKVNRNGDTMTGALILAKHPDDNLEAATKYYVDQHAGTGGTGGIPDAPADGKTYARKNNLWTYSVALSGDTMTGPLILSGDPTAPFGAATKQYVDNSGAAAANKVSKAGDTMTGPLSMGTTVPASLNPKSILGYTVTATGIFLNGYQDAGGVNRILAAGFGGIIGYNPATGDLSIGTSDAAGAADAAHGTITKLLTLRGADGALDVPKGIRTPGAGGHRVNFDATTLGPYALFMGIDGGTKFEVWSTNNAPNQLSLNGYQRLPNGFIFQFGYASGGGADFFTAFPTAFPGACINVQATISDNTAALQSYTVSVGNVSAGGFWAFPRYSAGGFVAAASQPIFWFAVGY